MGKQAIHKGDNGRGGRAQRFAFPARAVAGSGALGFDELEEVIMSFDIVYVGLGETGVITGRIWIRDPHAVWLVCDNGGTGSDDDDDEFPFPVPPNHLVVDTSRLDGPSVPAVFALEKFTRRAAELIAGEVQRVDIDPPVGESWGLQGRIEAPR